MYLPAHFEQSDPDILLEVMQRHNFATMVSLVDGELFATHVPVLVRPVAGAADGTQEIVGHMARANAHWRALQTSPAALVIFQGPHTYISPTLFSQANRVPTWNYIVVHANGSAVVDESDVGKVALLEALIAHHEAAYQPRFEALDPGMREGLLGAIVGFTIRIERLQGKFKIGQHRLAGDRPEMQAWHEAGGENERALAGWMKRLGYWS